MSLGSVDSNLIDYQLIYINSAYVQMSNSLHTCTQCEVKIIHAYTYIRIHVLKNGLLLMYMCNKTTFIYVDVHIHTYVYMC